MRMSQYVGLNAWARSFVTRKEKVREYGVRVFKDGRRKRFSRWARFSSLRREDAGVIRGMGGEPFAKLYRYILADGSRLHEYVQAEIWSGGPCYFIALKRDDGTSVPESLWTEDELQKA